MADFLTLSPEVNSARMYAGGGPGSLSAAAAAWDELAAELWLAAASFESVCSGLADRWWQGPSSRMMAAQAARHTGWLAAAATQAEGAASQAQTMALAYEAAFAATVHPALVAANRALVAWLAGSNVFGQNTPAIAAAEAIYEQMWAQDVVAMLNYHAVASAVGARLRPWQQLLHELPRRLGGEHSDSTNTELANPSSTTTRITVPGASPVHAATLLPFIGRLLAARYAELNTAIGTNWFPGTTPEVVSYPATIGVLSGSLGAVDANQSIAIGQQMLHNEILAATASGQPVTVAGLSMGSMVIDRELAYLAIDPNAPPSSALTFVELAGPERGLAQTYLPVGTTIPIAGYTVGNAPESQYNTTVVNSQYDIWADPPDRPWNLLAGANALMGAAYFHDLTAYAAPQQGIEIAAVTSSLGGTTTTYMIPSPTLPLLLPLKQIGVPDWIVGGLNNVLKPLVDAGYSQYAPTAGPYFSHGNLVW